MNQAKMDQWQANHLNFDVARYEHELIAIVDETVADSLVDRTRQHPLGVDARIIGTITEANPGLVTMRTIYGTTRVVDMLAGDQLPRIC